MIEIALIIISLMSNLAMVEDTDNCPECVVGSLSLKILDEKNKYTFGDNINIVGIVPVNQKDKLVEIKFYCGDKSYFNKKIPFDLQGKFHLEYKLNPESCDNTITTYDVIVKYHTWRDTISFEYVSVADPIIPSWIKTNAGWWADGSIDDDAFVQGIQFLIKEGIMQIPPTAQGSINQSNEIPSWIKTNAGWWADGSIDDDAFVQGIQFLIKEGIIKIES